MTRKPPLKTCSQCGQTNAVRSKACSKCGSFFPRTHAELPPDIVSRETIGGESLQTQVYVPERNFSHSFDGTTVQFAEGKPIADQAIIARLLAVGAPIRALEPGTRVVHCPHCRQAFPLMEGTEH